MVGYVRENLVKFDENSKVFVFGETVGSFTAATDMETLKQRKITYILTLDICPLPTHVTELPFLTTKFIHSK